MMVTRGHIHVLFWLMFQAAEKAAWKEIERFSF